VGIIYMQIEVIAEFGKLKLGTRNPSNEKLCCPLAFVLWTLQ
jgi:hypothetical protein